MKSSSKAFFTLTVCAVAWTSGHLLAQDDMGAAAPPPPPPPGDMGSGPGMDPNGGGPPPGVAPDASQDTGAVPEGDVTFQTFYDNLAPEGNWIQTTDFGYVWQPTAVSDPDWAPYTVGHWVYSDDGWTWASDEPWGWATYHYGRWTNLNGVGWVWVPGYTWAPAWVSWRYNDDAVGWAPLPPDSFMGIDYANGDSYNNDNFHIGGDCDSYYDIGPGCYQFLPIIYIGFTNYHGHYYNRHRNYDFINHTTNVTNINVTRHNGHVNTPSFHGSFNHVTTGGPSFTQVNAVAKTPVEKVNIVHSRQPGTSSLSKNTLSLYAPRFNPSASGDAKPTHVSTTVQHATINHGTDISKPLAVNPHLAPPPPSAAEVQQAHQAQAQAPTRAKVATSENTGKPILTAPLNSLKPVVSPVGHPQGTNPNNPPNHTNPSWNQGGTHPNAVNPPNGTETPQTHQNFNQAPPTAPVHPTPHAPPSEPSTPPTHQGFNQTPSAPVHNPPSAPVHTPQVEQPEPSAPPAHTPHQSFNQPDPTPAPQPHYTPQASPPTAPSHLGGPGGGGSPSYSPPAQQPRPQPQSYSPPPQPQSAPNYQPSSSGGSTNTSNGGGGPPGTGGQSGPGGQGPGHHH